MPSLPPDDEYYCETCRRRFPSAQHLLKHLKGAAHFREVEYKKRTAAKQQRRKDKKKGET